MGVTRLRTEQLLTKLVAGLPLTGEECRRVRGYLDTLMVMVERAEHREILREICQVSAVEIVR